MVFDMDMYGQFFVQNMPYFKQKENYFRAFGLEDVVELAARMTDVSAPVLIGVDAFECESEYNRGDALNDTRSYAFILAAQVPADEYSATWKAVMQECYDNLKQIRNFLVSSFKLKPFMLKDTRITGYGPVGDGFYGAMLNFRTTECQDYRPDSAFFDNLNPLYDGSL